MTNKQSEFLDQLITETSLRISQLKAEAAKYRVQRNEARRELEALRAELAEVRSRG